MRLLMVVRGDVLDRSSLTAAVGKSEAVICALGTPSPRRPGTLLRDGTQNLVEAMTQAGVRRLVCVTLLGAGPGASNTSLFYGQVILRFLAPIRLGHVVRTDLARFLVGCAAEGSTCATRSPSAREQNPGGRGDVRMYWRCCDRQAGLR